MPPPTLSSSSKKSGHCLHLAEMLPSPPPPKACRVPCEVPGKASFPLSPRWPRRGPSAAPPGHPPLSWLARRLGGAGSPPPREVAGLGSPCKKYSAEITPLAGNASRASSSLGLHNRPDFTLTLSVQAQKALASIGQAINPAERARFKCSRANRRDFPGGARRTAGCAPAALGSGSAPR